MTTSFLMARRLVEAGARYVSLNFSRWDWHSNNFDRGRTDIPMLDNALTSLVEDLHERGLGQGCNRSLLGRVWTHPENQRQGWTRPLAQGQLLPSCWRRPPHWTGHWLH